MIKIIISLLLLGTSTLVVANSYQIEKIYISSDKSISIPKIKDTKLQEYSYSIKDKKLKPFYISKYETTINQYIKYKKANNLKLEIEIDEDSLNEPITNIDFDTALKVCKFYKGRLPTELEWIVSASIKLAPSKCYEYIKDNSFSPYPTKNYPLKENDKHIGCMMEDDDEIEADLIGSELLEVEDSYENINGTYGMLGNVWEWVDEDKKYFNQSYKTIKGGSFANFEQNELFDSRVSNFIKPDTKMTNIGFRCVWDIADKQKATKK